MLDQIRSALSGRKTYVLAAMVILIGVAEGWLGIDVPGVAVGDDPIAWILAGLGMTTLRRGVAKA